MPRIYGRRLAPTDQESKVAEHGDERKHNSPDRIEMLDGIEGYTSEHSGRWVAGAVCRPGMSRFMHADGKNQRDVLERYLYGLEIHARCIDGITPPESQT